MKRNFIAVGLFTGCGGSSLGLEMAGIEELVAIDNNENAVKTHERNFTNTKCLQVKVDESPEEGKESTSSLIRRTLLEMGYSDTEIDLMQFSPPCQFFSMCNTFGFDKELIQPFHDSIAIIKELRPKTFIIENVEGALAPSRAFIWNGLKKALDETGYVYAFKKLNAKDFGVPQSRVRLIIVGVRQDLAQMGLGPVFPRPLGIDPSRLALSNVLPSKPAFFSMSQFKDSLISGQEICHTLTKTPNLKLYDSLGSLPRKATIEELKSLSSFPESFEFVGSYTDKVNRIGNCVPPLFMRAIAGAIRKGILEPYYEKIDRSVK
ncbi:MAG: DNA (cytosine-5-)-methyltransferase [Bacteroidetes bacterium]|nr:MAG: DNA (cytosine-5-)-methyltransferase [Bacteroidota bacterium]